MFTGTVSIKLSSPVAWEDKKISVVELDFSKVNGAALIEAERACGENITSILKPQNIEYCTRLAEKISGVSYRILTTKLNYGDHLLVWQTVGAFLRKANPQTFYKQALDLDTEDSETDDGVGFTGPAELPGMAEEG